MLNNFSWVIPQKLAGSALPGGYACRDSAVLSDLLDLHRRGVRCLVSLTSSASHFGPLCRQAGLIWHYFPISDFSVPPDAKDFQLLVSRIIDHIQRGQPVCAHCYAGIGRTGLVLCCTVGRYLQLSGAEAIRTVQALRPALETGEQERFVHTFLE
jgi:atypical dual specificity phosphatase